MAKENTQSPIGKLMYVMVAGQGKENYDGDGYEYQCCVDVPEAEAEEYINYIEDFIEDNAPAKGERATNKHGDEITPYTYAEDDDTIDDGLVRFTFKTKTEFEQKNGDMKSTDIAILDTGGTRVKLPEGKFIGNGSTGKVVGTLAVWSRGTRKKIEYGASLYLNKVQIKDFIPYEGEKVEAIEDGSFKGFDNELEPDNGESEQPPKRRSRRSRR